MKINIEKNCISKIISSAIICLMVLIFNQSVGADVTTERINIKCSQTPGVVFVHKIRGFPDTQLSLITEGIAVSDIDELITDWSAFRSKFASQAKVRHIDSEVVVVTTCVPYSRGDEITDLTIFGQNMWPPGTMISCRKGEGLSITMSSPKDTNPNKYRYIATLIRSKDDECDDNKLFYIDTQRILNARIENSCILL